MISYLAMIAWGLFAVSIALLLGLLFIVFRIVTVLVSVTQELRWTAEAYSGRDYKKEAEVHQTPDDGKRVQIEPPWDDDLEAKG